MNVYEIECLYDELGFKKTLENQVWWKSPNGFRINDWMFENEWMIMRTLDYTLHAWYKLTVATVWGRVCVIVRKNEPKPKLPVRVKTGQWSGNGILRPLKAEIEKTQNWKVVGNWKL